MGVFWEKKKKKKPKKKKLGQTDPNIQKFHFRTTQQISFLGLTVTVFSCTSKKQVQKRLGWWLINNILKIAITSQNSLLRISLFSIFLI